MKKLGRPTKYKRKIRQLAYDFLAKGYSKEALAGKLGIHKDTLYEWIAKYEEFSDAVKRGEAASRLLWERMGIDAAQGKIPHFNTSIWIFNMKNRFGWREKQEIDANHPQILTVGLVSYEDSASILEESKQIDTPLNK